MEQLNLSSSSPATLDRTRPVYVIRVLIYLGVLVAFLCAIPVVRFFSWAKTIRIHAYHTSGASMCPAICEREFFVAGLDSYRVHQPQRGDIIMFLHGESNTLYIKRVIGIAGDTVEPGPANSLLVNGAPLVFPKPCGDDVPRPSTVPHERHFAAVKVPANSLFVIGDNLDKSYDSRDFGVVSLDTVRAKPLFIYSSPNPSRFGCRIN